MNWSTTFTKCKLNMKRDHKCEKLQTSVTNVTRPGGAWGGGGSSLMYALFVVHILTRREPWDNNPIGVKSIPTFP